MNYYTATIPPTLAEKLKEKGMPITYHPLFTPEIEGADQSVGLIRPMYCEVFDWLMERGKIVVIDYDKYVWLVGIVFKEDSWLNYRPLGEFPTWHEAADAAIEKALTLI